MNFENRLKKDVGIVTRIRIGVLEIVFQNPLSEARNLGIIHPLGIGGPF